MVASLGFSSLLPSVAQANISFTVDAGYLRPAVGDTTPLETMKGDGSPGDTGSLLLLVETGSSLPTTLGAGSYLNPGETLVAAFPANSMGAGGVSGTDPLGMEAPGIETLNTPPDVAFPGVTGNGYVELRWFPSITYSQYMAGTVPTAGTLFGAYNPLLYPLVNGANLAPDGGSDWVVPSSDGASGIQYIFATSDNTGMGAFAAGSQDPSEGLANFVVTVPEPSTVVSVLLGGAALVFAGKRIAKRRRLARPDLV